LNNQFQNSKISYSFSQPYNKAANYFQSLGIIDAPTFYSNLDKYAGTAFTISYITKTETLSKCKSYLTQQLGTGKVDPKKLKAKIQEFTILNGDDPLEAWHLNTIARTNIQTAFSKGRYQEQKKSPNEFFKYFATLDGRETDLCHYLDGKVFKKSDLFWQRYYPPNHFNCRSYVESLDIETIEELGDQVIPSGYQFLKQGRKSHPKAKLKAPKGFNTSPDKGLHNWIKNKAQELNTPIKKTKPPHFKTKAEAERYLNSKLNIPVSFTGIPIETVNTLIPSLLELRNRSKIFWDEIKTFKRKDLGVFFANRAILYRSGKIRNVLNINKNTFQTFAPEEIKKHTLKAYNKNHWTSKNFTDLLTHELGHCLTYSDLPAKYFNHLNRPVPKHLPKTSTYGQTDLAEYLAETFVNYANGINLDKSQIELLSKFIELDKIEIKGGKK
jgi:SPP1 gp7 family putative phage head morphogenesis protein